MIDIKKEGGILPEDSGDASLPPELVTAAAELDHSAMQLRINDLIRTSKALLQHIGVILNILRKSPHLSPDQAENKFDMTDLGRQLLELPSSFFSDMLGGNEQQSINDRLVSLARLQAICELDNTKLILHTPQLALNDYLSLTSDNSKEVLAKSQILQSTFKSASSTPAKGDASGYAMSELLNLRRDQQWICQTNNVYITLAEPLPEYKNLNECVRKPYEDPIMDLIKGALSYTDDYQYVLRLRDAENHLLGLVPKPVVDNNSTSAQSAVLSRLPYRSGNLAAYTARTLFEVMTSFGAIEKECISVTKSICDTLGAIIHSILPELAKVSAISIDIQDIVTTLDRIDTWWENSPFIPLRGNIISAGLNRDAALILKDNGPNELVSLFNSLLVQVQMRRGLLLTMIAMHPALESRTPPTPIHVFTHQWQHTLNALIDQVVAMQPLLGAMDRNGLAISSGTFTYAYAELRVRFQAIYKTKLSQMPSGSRERAKSTDCRQPSPSPAQVDGVGLSRGSRTDSSASRLPGGSVSPRLSRSRDAHFARSEPVYPKSPTQSPRKSGTPKSSNSSPRQSPGLASPRGASGAVSPRAAGSAASSPRNAGSKSRSQDGSPRATETEDTNLEGLSAELAELTSTLISVEPRNRGGRVVNKDDSIRRKSLKNRMVLNKSNSGSLTAGSFESPAGSVSTATSSSSNK